MSINQQKTSGKKAKLSTETLRHAALEIMRRAGKTLVHDPSRKGQIYSMATGETVRLRTSSDRNLTCKSTHPDLGAGKLDIEGTELLVFAVPTAKRGMSRVEAFCIPTDAAVKAIKDAHVFWLKHLGQSRGANFTPALTLDNRPSGQTATLQEIWSSYKIGELRL